MTTLYYLNKLKTVLPSVQGKQIMRLLSKKKEDGEIRTTDELRDKLKQLTENLLQNKIQPTLKLWLAGGKKDISSEQWNEMMERIEDDLEAAFEEANNLYELLDVHDFLIKTVALQSLEASLRKLEAQVETYQFLRRADEGFDDALFNTFRSSVGAFTDRESRIGKTLFVDPRSLTKILPSESAVVDPVGERLILGAESSKYISLKSVESLTTSTTTHSELDVSFKDVDIANIIDGKKQTYWAIPILLSSPLSTGAYAEIAVELPSFQDITFVEIEPATEKPMLLDAIAYLNMSKEVQYVDIEDILLDRETIRVDFQKISTSKLILKFRQDNYTEVQFKKKSLSNLSQVLSNSLTFSKPSDISVDEDILGAITQPFISSNVLGLRSIQEVTAEYVRYYEYIFALDNVRVGRSKYNDIGIFVSDKKVVDHPSQLGLRVEEKRPVQESGYQQINSSLAYSYPERSSSENSKIYHGSIEYWATIEFLNSSGDTEQTITVPVFPLNSFRAYHEHLVLTKTIGSGVLLNNAGSLMFFATANSDNVTVYKNGLALAYMSDWEFVADGHSSGLTVESSNTGWRMRRGIKITNRDRLTDIYTVSYTPSFSTSFSVPANTNLMSVVDLSGDLSARLAANGTITIEPGRISEDIVKANIYLVVILRRISRNNDITPVVEEFLLAVGSKDTEKFEE